MTRDEKTAAIADLQVAFDTYPCFYVTDSSALTAAQVNTLRRRCFEKGIKLSVVKNTLALKALKAADESRNYAEVFDAFHGPTAIMFTENAKAPAFILEAFRKTSDKPKLKAAYIDSAVFLGDDIEAMTKLKTKEDVLGQIVGMLMSPIQNVVGAILSGEQQIAGLVKALEERES